MSGYRGDPQALPLGEPPVLRGRGDRRGVEPRVPQDRAPPPDRPPGWWKLGARGFPVWDGRPANTVLVDLVHGGLGDAVRLMAVMRGAVRSGRIRNLVVVTRPGMALDWLTEALAPLRVCTPDQLGEAVHPVAPAIHMIPPNAWSGWPTPRLAPLTSLVCDLWSIPVAAMAGPVLNIALRDRNAVLQQLGQAGWMGEPVVAVQTGTHPVGPALTVALRNERVPPALDASIPHLTRHGCFVLRIGAMGGAEAVGRGFGVVDLGDSSIGVMLAAIHLADLAVTGDSGPLHFASCVGTPTLALFGPSDADIGVWAAGTVPLLPPAEACERLPCGRGSVLGGPLEADNVTRIPLPCPPEGGCLTRLAPESIAHTALRMLQHRDEGRTP